MKHAWPLAALAAVSLVGTACNDSTSGPVSPSPSLDALASFQQGGKTLDDEFESLAQEIPGFGGVYFDASGTAVIRLVNFGQSAAARRRIRDFLAVRGRGDAPISIEPAQYGFPTLRQWQRRSSAVFSVPGAVFTDVDEKLNRVRIGITLDADLNRVEALLRAQGVPAEAVVISRTESVRFLISLQERIRPVRGGTQIQFSLGSCTIGFTAYTYNAFGHLDSLLFLTASHCTNVQGGVEGTQYYQASKTATIDYVGREVADPAYFTGGVCPAGRRCRYSDAAKVYIDATGSVGLGWIARTTSRGRYTGSLTLDLNNSYFSVTSETSAPLLGDWVDKIGRTTGWTYGPVQGTCVETDVANSDIHLLCQNYVDGGSGPGDSGSPVFRWSGNTASLYGILWGGVGSRQFWFSSLGRIEQELGPLNTINPL